MEIKEIWKPIEGYEGLYEVSNLGRVKNKNGVIIKGSTASTGGYHMVSLCKNGQKKWHRVHRLVAKAFVPNPRGVNVVNHIDECKTNNNAENLEWVTQKENVNYRGAKERLSRSMKNYYANHDHHGCKPVRCVETNKVYASAKEASRELGLSRGLISGVLHGWHRTAGGYHWEWA